MRNVLSRLKPAPVFVLSGALALTACDVPIRQIADYGNYQVLSLDASQRLVIAGTRQEIQRDAHGNLIRDAAGNPIIFERNVVCAEPSPDALVATAAYATGGANITGTGSGNATAGINQAAANIGLRTRTIQLLRDGYFRVCEAYLNGAIDSDEYKGIIRSIDHFMVVLVAIEAIAGSPTAPPASISASVDISQPIPNEDGDPDIATINSNLSDVAARIDQLSGRLETIAQTNAASAEQSDDIRQIVFQFLAYLNNLRSMQMR